MSIQLKIRRGTAVQNDAFTGAEAELTYDTTSKGLRIHDGETQGGHEVPVLIAVQRPTAENGYTWYRKYSDGWVEQGGYYYKGSSVAGNNTITLPVEMADTNYTVLSLIQFTAPGNAYVEVEVYPSRTTTSFVLGVPSADYGYNWEVKGMAA